MLLKKNDDIQLLIEGYSAEGNGVGHYNKLAVFVSGAAAGDTVTAHIIKVKKSYAIATIKQIITPSSDRILSDCGVFMRCGGCCFRHITYDSECTLKRQRIDDAFARIGKLPVKVESFIPCDNPDSYRNKAMLPVGRNTAGKTVVGFFSQKSHRVIPCPDCALHPAVFNTAAEIFTSWADRHKLSVYDETNTSGLLRHLYIRYAEATGQLMVCPVINAESLPHSEELVEKLKALPGLRSVMLNINKDDTNVILGRKCVCLYGSEHIEDVLCNVKVRLSPLSFYQVNRSQAQRLYQTAAELADLKKDDILLDLYCGAGTIGLSMASKVKSLIGVEIVPEAIADAKANALLNKTENARFICADASEAAEKLKEEGIQPNVIVLDPPRKGCAPELICTVAGMMPERIVYVSCDPATLARDCALLKSLGYEVKHLTGVDMFPRTAHVETVCLLSKLHSEHHI